MLTITNNLKSRVAYHGDTSHFFGIGISWYISDTAGIGIFRSVLLYCKIWREHLFKISLELFFWKIPPEFLFFFKRRVKCTKRGRGPPFLGKRGLPPFFWGAPAKILIPKILIKFSFGIGMVNTEKYRPIPTKKYRFGMQLYILLGK